MKITVRDDRVKREVVQRLRAEIYLYLDRHHAPVDSKLFDKLMERIRRIV